MEVKIQILIFMFLCLAMYASSTLAALCEPSPCENNGTCVVNGTTFSCQCTSIWNGENCTEPIPDPCTPNPCLNNSTCSVENDFYICTCLEGFQGVNCTSIIDKCSNTCSGSEICDEMSLKCECPPGHARMGNSTCAPLCDDNAYCGNNGTCYNTTEGLQCECFPGINGTQCGDRYSYCLPEPCNNNGICVSKLSEQKYVCYCAQGYVGLNCESELNVCLSNPCYNGTCNEHTDLDGVYSCDCADGFSGRNCEIEIDECETSPCKNGATCTDYIASYECTCVEGWTGGNCTINIDECESSPCQNNSTCVDQLNKYTCECIPGYEGTHCEMDIDECASTPCQHGTLCTHGIDFYTCNCSGSGYEGTNCEVEIDECESSPCENGGSCTNLINDFECECFDAYTGKQCQMDTDECTPIPCEHESTCLERSHSSLYNGAYFDGEFKYEFAAGYACNCTAGYKGENCEMEINECLVEPCQNNATCVDKIADYHCLCMSEYGGKNCSVLLRGCYDNACSDEGSESCLPHLEDELEDVHGYTCTCRHGYTGDHCDKDTSVTFNGEASVETNFVDIISSFTISFRTNQANGVIVSGLGDLGDEFVKISLVSGEFHLMVQNETFVVSEPMSDSDWHLVSIALNKDGISFGISDESGCMDGCTGAVGSPSPINITKLIFGKSNPTSPVYRGCMRDISVDGELYLAGEASSIFQDENVSSPCVREDVCFQDTCSNVGNCVDLWTDFSCYCQNPFIDKDCSRQVTPATFSNENTTSFSKFEFNQVLSTILISFFVRTRDSNGPIISLQNNTDNENVFRVFIENGKMKISIGEIVHDSKFNLNDGNLYFVEVVFEKNDLRCKVNESIVGSFIATSFTLPASTIYIGNNNDIVGMERKKRSLPSDINSFKGMLQDIVINNVKLMFFDNDIDVVQNYLLPTSSSNVLQGAVSDDNCALQPCANDGACVQEFNHRTCTCGVDWRGEDCSLQSFCFNASCVSGSTCLELGNGFECVPTVTYNGVDQIQMFTPINQTEFEGVSVKFRTRSPTANIFTIEFSDTSEFRLSTNSIGEIFVSKDMDVIVGRVVNDGHWHDVSYSVDNSLISIDESRIASSFRFTNSQIEKITIAKDQMKGCMSDFRINGFLLPLLNQSHKDATFVLTSDSVAKAGCHGDDVCADTPCFHGDCNDLFNEYNCSCNPGYTGTNCTIDINECETSSCVHGTCVDRINHFICECIPGFNGTLCEFEIDECETSPCQNNGSCTDLIDNYQCNCTTNFTGVDCQYDASSSCLSGNEPCINDGICTNITTSNFINFNCTCPQQYKGEFCELEVDFCENVDCGNGTCIENKSSATYSCQCIDGFNGTHCELDIDECELKPCLNQATCINENGGYRCQCRNGWFGGHCSQDVNECLNEDCSGHGNCFNTIGSFKCTCEEGYEGSICEVTGPCSNKPCVHGECFQNTNTMEYRCDCKPGWMGVNCSTKDICFYKPCMNGGVCTQKNNSEEISCNCTNTGYSGANCTGDTNECLDNPCGNRATCENTIGSYKCNCTPKNGYFDSNCKIRNICISDDGTNYCMNNGVCSIGVEENGQELNQTCNCTSKYAGLRCQHSIPCVTQSNLCMHRGQCLTTWPANATDVKPGYICVCRTGYSGTNCESFVWLVAGSSLGAVGFILLVVLLLVMLMYVRRVRKTKGVYEPRATELVDTTTTASTDMFHFANLKVPRKALERLI